MTIRHFFSTASLAGLVAISLSAPAAAQEAKAPPPILFTNVDVFDGFGPELIEDANVLVEGNVITQVSTDPIEVEGAFEVDGTGKTMTPGFIDMHQHVMLNMPEGTASLIARWDEAASGAFAQRLSLPM